MVFDQRISIDFLWMRESREMGLTFCSLYVLIQPWMNSLHRNRIPPPSSPSRSALAATAGPPSASAPSSLRSPPPLRRPRRRGRRHEPGNPPIDSAVIRRRQSFVTAWDEILTRRRRGTTEPSLLWHRAFYGTLKPIVRGGQVVATLHRPDNKAAMSLLNRMDQADRAPPGCGAPRPGRKFTVKFSGDSKATL